MKINISDKEFDAVFSELKAHRELPVGHSDCAFCDFAKELVQTIHGQALAEDSENTKQFLDRAFHLYCGVRIGRSQGVSDLIAEYEKGEENAR